jgi:HSP20 family molecular chaperone IbpA
MDNTTPAIRTRFQAEQDSAGRKTRPLHSIAFGRQIRLPDRTKSRQASLLNAVLERASPKFLKGGLNGAENSG